MANNFNLTDASALFKIKYGKLSDNVYNSYNVLFARVRKTFDFTGSRKDIAVPQGFSGGVGSGTLPQANKATYASAQITAKKVYSRVEIDRESIKASMNDEGAFVRGTKHVVQKGVESWMRNMERILFNDGTGAVARGAGATNVSGDGTSGTPFVCVLNSDTVEANVEIGDMWNYDAETATANNLEVVNYVPSTYTVSLVGTSAGLTALSGSGPVPTNKYFHMQGSKDNDPEGLKGVLDATAGSKYGISIGRRWQAGSQIAAGGASLTTDLLNQQMLEIQRKSGKVPNLMLMSFTQYRKLLNLVEDQKMYPIKPRDSRLEGKLSMSSIQFMSAAGPIPCLPARFCDEDRVYCLNDNYISLHHRPDFGWFEDDGTIFLRKADDDLYEARYGGYLQAYIVPNFHGVITGLAT